MGLEETTMALGWIALLAVVVVSQSGCRRSVKSETNGEDGSSFVLPPGGLAGGVNETLLANVRKVTTDKAPAALRPDPDLFVRRLLRQYRSEGPLIARQIGSVENFRLLLGGASEDFRTAPQESYDATSLLAMQKVAEELCRSLVAPTEWEHPGWRTILPRSADATSANLRYLAQRLLGLPSSRIPADVMTDITKLTDAARADPDDDANEFDIYVPACVALSTDAEALLL